MDGRGGRSRRSRRRRSERPLTAAAAALWLTLAAPAAALAAPTPSPSLDRLLASPPSPDYVADTESAGTPIGAFDLPTYVQTLGPADPNAAERALHDDGFVAGYGRSWTSQATSIGVVEVVVAFAGGRGAESWLKSAEADAKSSRFFKGSIEVPGLGQYYAVHYADLSAPSFADVVSFIKGNDYFVVGVISDAQNLGDSAAAQGRRQYDFAAAVSIAEARWPENAKQPPFGLSGGRLAVAVLIVGLGTAAVVGLATALLLFRQRRSGPSSPAGGSSGGSTPSTPPT